MHLPHSLPLKIYLDTTSVYYTICAKVIGYITIIGLSSWNIAVVAVMSSNVGLMYFPPQSPLVMVLIYMLKWSAGYTGSYAYHSGVP